MKYEDLPMTTDFKFLRGYIVRYSTSLTAGEYWFFWATEGAADPDIARYLCFVHASAACERIGGYGPVQQNDIRLRSVEVAYSEIIQQEASK